MGNRARFPWRPGTFLFSQLASRSDVVPDMMKVTRGRLAPWTTAGVRLIKRGRWLQGQKNAGVRVASLESSDSSTTTHDTARPASRPMAAD